jgi:hypothetical protein
MRTIEEDQDLPIQDFLDIKHQFDDFDKRNSKKSFPKLSRIPFDPLDPKIRHSKVKSPTIDPINDLFSISQIPLKCLRTGQEKRLAWYRPTESPDVLERQAAQYLRCINYDMVWLEIPAVALIKAVCNLRMYYQQSVEQTVRRILEFYCRRAVINWSIEDIVLAWELSERFTPSLGWSDERGIARRRVATIKEDVGYLLEYTLPGGRTDTKELLALFHEWNPDFTITPRELGVAVRSIKDITSKGSNGKCYYPGFHIPVQEELHASSHQDVA